MEKEQSVADKLEEFLGSRHISLKKEDMVRLIGISPSAFSDLKEIALSGRQPVSWRAAWLMDTMAEEDPSLPHPEIERLWQAVFDNHPDGVKRSLLRMLCRYDIPEVFEGVAVDQCFDWLQKDIYPVALKVYAMEMLYKVAASYPELAGEFIEAIRVQLPYGSAGYKARASRIIGQLEKL